MLTEHLSAAVLAVSKQEVERERTCVLWRAWQEVMWCRSSNWLSANRRYSGKGRVCCGGHGRR